EIKLAHNDSRFHRGFHRNKVRLMESSILRNARQQADRNSLDLKNLAQEITEVIALKIRAELFAYRVDIEEVPRACRCRSPKAFHDLAVLRHLLTNGAEFFTNNHLGGVNGHL